MRALMVVTLGMVFGCSATEPGDSINPKGDSPIIPKLEVTERSGTTLSLRWDAIDTASTYAVDTLTGIAQCKDFPTHNTGVVIKGTTTRLTGLSPATRYHVHVHPLPFSTKVTNTVFVLTLAPDAPVQAVVAADYERCTSGP